MWRRQPPPLLLLLLLLWPVMSSGKNCGEVECMDGYEVCGTLEGGERSTDQNAEKGQVYRPGAWLQSLTVRF